MSENFKFFQHRECEFFPCHENANAETFNCLFCYCPLYALGEGYDYMMSKYVEIMEIAKKKD